MMLDLKKQKHINILSVGLGLPVTLFLFFIMANLISRPAKLGKSSDSENFIDFIRNTSELQTQTRKRSMPKKPPKAENPPARPKIAVSKSVSAAPPKMAMNMPVLGDSLALGDGPYLGGGVSGGSGDRDEMPLVRIEPQYPRQAAMAGKEGWVRLRFDINESGNVTNVRVLDSRPRRVFDQSAKRALYKWKYRPKMVDGKPAPRKNITIRLDFKLRDE